MYEQVKTPNLDPILYQPNAQGVVVRLLNWLGYCLAYVQTAFGAGWSGPSAWVSWTTYTQGKQGNRNFPLNVYFPIWFDGYWNGNRFGHTAVAYFDGSKLTIWSSPLSNKPYADTFNSIAAVEKAYGMTFVGWSTHVGATQVIRKKEDDVVKIGKESNWRWRFNRLHWQLVGNWEMSDQVFNSIVGQDAWKQVEQWSDHQNANQSIADQKLGELARKDNWQRQIYDLQDVLKKRPTAEQFSEAKRIADELASRAKAAETQAEKDRQAFVVLEGKLREAEAQAAEDAKAGEGFIRRLGQFISKFFNKEK